MCIYILLQQLFGEFWGLLLVEGISSWNHNIETIINHLQSQSKLERSWSLWFEMIR